jgi:hypothetical protein
MSREDQNNPAPRFYWYQVIFIAPVFIPLFYCVAICLPLRLYSPILFYWAMGAYSLMVLVLIGRIFWLMRSAYRARLTNR